MKDEHHAMKIFCIYIITDSLHLGVVIFNLSLLSVFIDLNNEVTNHADTEEEDNTDDLG